MKLNALILLVTILLGFSATYYMGVAGDPSGSMPSAAKEDAAALAGKLPAFSMTDLNGAPHESSDFVGKTVLVNFWASWCTPCVAEFPRLLELARRNPDNMVLLAISSDTSEQAIRRFFKKLKAEDASVLVQKNVLVVYDQDSRITFDIFKTVKLPETVIVDPQQQMIRKLVGADWRIEDVQALIAKP